MRKLMLLSELEWKTLAPHPSSMKATLTLAKLHPYPYGDQMSWSIYRSHDHSRYHFYANGSPYPKQYMHLDPLAAQALLFRLTMEEDRALTTHHQRSTTP